MRNIFFAICFFISFSVFGVCGAETRTISVSIEPVKFLVEKIAGDKFILNLLVPPNSDPHTFELKPKQLIKYGNSKYYFSIGDSFESVWLKKLLGINKDIKVYHIDKGVEKIFSDDEHHHDEHHHSEAEIDDELHNENDGEKKHYNYDPHIWFSVKNARIIIKNIYSALAEIDPDNREYYYENYKLFDLSLSKLDNYVNGKIKKSGVKKILVYHPILGYFARDYNLIQLSIEEEGKEPSLKHMKNVIDIAKRDNIKFIFVQPQINSKVVDVIARDINGKIVMIDPLKYDYLTELKRIPETFYE